MKSDAKMLVVTVLLRYLFLLMLLGHFCVVQFQVKSFNSAKLEVKCAISLIGQAAMKCLRESDSPYKVKKIDIVGLAEREVEFYRLLEVTRWTRDIPSHSYCGYSGPWLEELWYKKMCCDWNMDNFGPFIPVFACWANLVVAMKHRVKVEHVHLLDLWADFISNICGQLSPKFIYITVLQMCYGMELCERPNPVIPGNLLILSQAGKGHVPLPLLLGPLKRATPLKPQNKVVFSGRNWPKRAKITRVWAKLLGDKLSMYTKMKNWTKVYPAYDFVLCPRGFGRCSFRTYEVLDLGLIPIICFRRRKWLPYLNTTLPWNDIALIDVRSSTSESVSFVLNASQGTIESMRANSAKYKHTHFSLDATVEQIRMWMSRGVTQSDLRCDRYYVDM